MKRILLVIVTVLLAAVVVVVSMLGSSPRTVHMAALTAIKKGDYEMAVSHLKRSDHPDASLLLSQMYYVPNKIEVVESTAEGELVSNENYVYNMAGQLYKHESTAADGTLIVQTNAYNSFGSPLLTKTEVTTPETDETEEFEEPVIEEDEVVEEKLFVGNQIEYFYDESGNLLCKRTSDSTGLFYQYRYTYDATGCLATEVYVDGEAKWSRREFTYDSNNYKLTERYTDYDDDWRNTTYTYEDGVLHTETVQNADCVSQTVYDKEGNILSFTVTRGGTSHVTQYTYDGNGNLLKKQYPEGHADVYRYNENGQLTDSEQVNTSGVVTVTNCTYDEDGRMLTRVTKEGDGERKETYTYNKKGQLVKKELVDLNGEVTTTEITYERYDNPETIVETAADGTVTTTTIQWKVRYYPDGMPDNVHEVYELYDVDSPNEEQ